MQNSTLPAKFPIPFANNAGVGYIRSIPENSQIGIQNGAASLHDGFPPWCFIPEVGYPFGQDFNGILNEISAWSQRYQAGQNIPYDGTFNAAIGGYPKGAQIGSATGFAFNWISVADNNTSNPDLGNNFWIPSVATPLWAANTGSANALAITIPIGIPSGISTTYTLNGLSFLIYKGSSANTGPCTLAVTDADSNVYEANLLRSDGAALAAGDLPAGSIFTVSYYSPNYYVQSLTPSILGLGTAAFKAASNTAYADVASVESATSGEVVVFYDNAGTIGNGGMLGNAAFKGVTNNSDGSVASVTSYTSGNLYAAASDGSLVDTGLSAAVYDSGVVALTYGALIQYAHSLGTTPFMWKVTAVCIAAGGDNGYSLNDELEVNYQNPSAEGTPASAGAQPWANATYIGLSTLASMTAPVKAGGGASSVFSLSTSNWGLRFRAAKL